MQSVLQVTAATAGVGTAHARLDGMKIPPLTTWLTPLHRFRGQLRKGPQRQRGALAPLAFIGIAATVVALAGYSIGFVVGQQQGTREAQAEAEATQAALKDSHAEELAAVRAARDELRAELQGISEQIREQVESARLSAGSLEDLQTDLAALRQRYAALDDRYSEQATQLEAADAEIERLRTRLEEQQAEHANERARLRAALLQAGLDGELADTHGTRFEQQLARFEQQLAVEREALTTLQRRWRDIASTLITELSDGTTLLSLEEVALFDSGATQLSAEGAARVEEVAALLQALPDYGVTVEGHTDAVPLAQSATADIRDNWGLSAIRAAATVAALEDAGIDPERLRAVGYASTRPLTEDPREGANRRVELMLYPPIEQRVLRLRQNQGVRPPADATELRQDSAETPD